MKTMMSQCSEYTLLEQEEMIKSGPPGVQGKIYIGVGTG